MSEAYGWNENTAEIEFLLESSEGVIPVEVKAGKNTRSRSLSSYKEWYAPLKAIKLIGAVGGADETDYALPLYFSYFLKRWV